MSKAPAFQFYAADFLVDVAEFKSCEIGDYIVLLATQWVNKDLPPEVDRLAKIVGESPEIFAHRWEKIKHKFELNDAGRLLNPRLEKARYAKSNMLDNTSNAGKAGAASRKGRILESVTYPFDTEAFKAAWDMWKKYKKDTHKFSFKTNLSEQMSMDKLAKDASNNEQTAIELIKYAIGRQWQGINVPYDWKRTNNKQEQSINPKKLNAFNSALNEFNKRD